MDKPILAIFLFVLVCAHLQADAAVWQPSPGHVQVPIWPGAVPDAMPNPKPESVGPPEGREWWPRANDVSQPTMTVYAAKGRNTGVAVVVFPGGGYQFLAMDLEGTEICDWLTSRGIPCVLLKYPRARLGPDDEERAQLLPEGANGAAGRAALARVGAPARRGVACRSAQGRRDRLFRRRAPRRCRQHAFRAADVSAGGCRRPAELPPGLRYCPLPPATCGRLGRT